MESTSASSDPQTLVSSTGSPIPSGDGSALPASAFPCPEHVYEDLICGTVYSPHFPDLEPPDMPTVTHAVQAPNGLLAWYHWFGSLS